jgi:hypothetical protein
MIAGKIDGGRNMAARTGIKDATVLSKTGKNWRAWFDLLDEWGAAGKRHKAAAQHLEARHGLSAWWSQMVTVAYERARGLRRRHGWSAIVPMALRSLASAMW